MIRLNWYWRKQRQNGEDGVNKKRIWVVGVTHVGVNNNRMGRIIMGEKNWIMVIDDDLAFLEMTEKILCEDYSVMLATSGKQALELLQSGKIPDLILLDIIMPHMDGYETFEHICDMERLSGVPVIFLTGKTNSEDELAGLQLGAQDYIMKPFISENLLARIRVRLEQGKQTRQLRIENSEQAQKLQNLQERIPGINMEEEIFATLSSTEKKVASKILRGYDNYEISVELNYAHKYVNNLVSKIYSKLGVKNRFELLRLYWGLL